MSSAPQRLLAALGLAVIYLLVFIQPLVDSRHRFLYHLKGPPSAVFLPVSLDVLLLTLVLFALLTVSQHFRRLGAALTLNLLAPVPWFLLRAAVTVSDLRLPTWLSPLSALFALLACAALFLVPLDSPRLAHAERLARTLLTFCGLNGFLVVTQLAWFAIAARSLNDLPALRQPTAVAPSTPNHGRVIWVLLDELSFDQVYEHRYPGLDLPAFDALAAQSTLFTHTVPAEIMTEKVVPSLITGQPADDIQTSASGKLVATHDPDAELWRPFNPTETIFGDALRAGYSTSVVGWFNPYCRILYPVLHHCFWQYTADRAINMRPDASLADNVLRPFSATWALVRGVLFGISPHNPERRGHLDDFLALQSAADRVLADPSQTMIFFHMSVPHPPGFFNRHTHTFQTTPGPSYIDNLALADLWIGHLREQLTRGGEWDADTVVIMGDHSWRTALIWGHSPFWTSEDQRASRNIQFDDRPVYLVKLPRQQQAARIEIPFRALRTRSLLRAIFSSSVRSPADLKAWVRSGQ